MTVSAPFNRRAIEDALMLWFRESTGLGERVHWEGQEGEEPAYPYATLRFGNVRSIGRDEEHVNGEPENPQDGREVAIEARGQREIVISCNTYTRPLNEDYTNDPEENAHALMDKARAALGMSEFLDPLCVAGASFLRASDTLNLDGIAGPSRVKRAQLDCVFAVASNAESRVGYIAHVQATLDLFP